MKQFQLLLMMVLGMQFALAEQLGPKDLEERTQLQCANLIYGGSQSSVCFADYFLKNVESETNLNVNKKFTPVKLADKRVYEFPFSVMSGEGDFKFTNQEKKNMNQFLNCGGFLLASPGCSDKTWDKAFRREMKRVFPDHPLKKIPMDHPIFSTVYNIKRLTLKNGGTALLEGIEINGRLAVVYSPEGLNDVKNAKGCCCCGGDQIKECQKVNVNIFTYALLY